MNFKRGLVKVMFLFYINFKEISFIPQKDFNIVQYFTKLKKLWDEFNCLKPIPHCSCETAKAVCETRASNQLVQCLMGLNDTCDHVRNEILVMHPLPSIKKAYFMILYVEKQREIHVSLETFESSAMLERSKNLKSYGGGKRNIKKKTNSKDMDRHCDHCTVAGCVKHTCFKFHPDRYTDLKGKKIYNFFQGSCQLCRNPLNKDQDSLTN